MEILKFVKSLLPTFGKDRLIEDARITRDELRKVDNHNEFYVDYYEVPQFA